MTLNFGKNWVRFNYYHWQTKSLRYHKLTDGFIIKCGKVVVVAKW